MNKNNTYDHFNKDLVANHSCSQKTYQNKFHLHNSYEIYFFIRGDVNYFVDKSCYRLKKGNMLIFNNQELHKAVILSDEPYERITIHFKPQFVHPICTEKSNLLSVFENRKIGEENITLLDASQSAYFMTTAMQMIQKLNSDDYGSDVLPLTYLIQILVMVNEIYSSKMQNTDSIISPKILSTLQYIDLHLTDNLSLDRISETLSIDKYHLSHMFKEKTGSTLYQYILLKRIALAKELLLNGKSVTETCHLSGFNDYSNFIRTFKNATGISPGSFYKNELSKH
jgi:AraC-like DNA-binding protein